MHLSSLGRCSPRLRLRLCLTMHARSGTRRVCGDGTIRACVRAHSRGSAARGVAPRHGAHTCVRACVHPPGVHRRGHTPHARAMTSHGWAPCGVDNERRSAGSLPLSLLPSLWPPFPLRVFGIHDHLLSVRGSLLFLPPLLSLSLSPLSLVSFPSRATYCFLFGLVTSGETRSSPRLVGGFALARY